ncbi:MAG TPA: hypothetical protein PKY82_32895 [Pyrinomonadaceae bacterium]|nr:hypothetical protein [Pyrinomonadaceae bacterium]
MEKIFGFKGFQNLSRSQSKAVREAMRNAFEIERQTFTFQELFTKNLIVRVQVIEPPFDAVRFSRLKTVKQQTGYKNLLEKRKVYGLCLSLDGERSFFLSNS